MKKLLLAVGLLGVVALFWTIQLQPNKHTTTTTTTTTQKSPLKLKKEQRIEEALKDNFERTKDLELGYPPVERLKLARKQAQAMQKQLALEKRDLANVRFQERGPNNIAGRTRTILIDRNDSSGKTVWAGAVSGGLWKTTNITAFDPKWTPIGDDLENLTVGAMVQDLKNPNLMFLGTGELYAGGLSSFVGTGIFRSQDGGDTWELLPATDEGPLSAAFEFTQDLLIHPESGELYAATHRGLYRSSDQGESWQLVLNGTIHEIEYGTNGKFIAATSGSVFRSSTGNQFEWTNLSTRPGFPQGLGRMETSVCKADPNIIYLLGNNSGSASSIYRSEKFLSQQKNLILQHTTRLYRGTLS